MAAGHADARRLRYANPHELRTWTASALAGLRGAGSTALVWGAGPDPLCTHCWEQSRCPRQFAHAPAEHEIFYGAIPSSSRVAQRLLYQCRPWIEATQAYDKHQLGLGDYFLNSLPLCWTACLLTDTVALLRARAMTQKVQPDSHPLSELFPRQMQFGL
jgi:hypothetical protein